METKEALELYRMAYKRAADEDEDKGGVNPRHFFTPTAALDVGKKMVSMQPQWVKDAANKGMQTMEKGVNWAASKTPGYKKLTEERDKARGYAAIAGIGTVGAVGALGAGGILLYNAIRKRLDAGKVPEVKG